MPTSVSEFDGVCYATAFYVQGGRVVVLGTHLSDRAGVREWLAATGHPRFRAYLTPFPGATPGFYVKPYVADVYYRIDPATGAANWDGQTRFGEPRPVTEPDVIRRAAPSAGGTELGPMPGSHTRLGRAVIRHTGATFMVMTAAIATFAGTGLMLTSPDGLATTFLMLAIATGLAAAGVAVMMFAGRGDTQAEAG